jgi:hypothetical protein
MIVDGVKGYILSETTLTEIADTDFPTPSGLTYQDGYFIVSVDSSGQFYISASYDGTSWDALDYATAEAYPDNLRGVLSSTKELWLIGEKSYEIWYNSGSVDFPFELIQGTAQRIGCAAKYSIAEHQSIVVWLDDKRSIRAAFDYSAQIISDPNVDYHLAGYDKVDDAIAYMYRQEGHLFYVITFPSQSKTWVYDFSTKLWHTRASGIMDWRHPVSCYTYYDGKHIVGDYDTGKLYEYDLSKYTDNGSHVRRIRTAQSVNQDRKNIFHHSLEVEFEGGVGLAVDDPDLGTGADPQAMLEWSDDGGHTWSNEHWADIGKIGVYANRARWTRLGSSRDRIYRVTIADPVKCVILGANLEATLGTS